MIKNKLPVRFTGQHFTIDKVLIADAIKIAKINETDTVLDIGAGKGFITVHLVRQSLVSGKLLLRIRKYLINNIFRGQTPVHDLKCLHLQSVS